eukprot:jgi/Bigna1/140357/aug1.55_g15065
MIISFLRHLDVISYSGLWKSFDFDSADLELFSRILSAEQRIGVTVDYYLRSSNHLRAGNKLLIQKEIWLLGATFAGSFLCFNVGTQYMHVSMAMVLRATEPLFAVAILMLRGGSVSLKIFCSLIMIVVGAGMSAFNESNLSLTGLGLLVVSNIGFTFRSILAKGIKDKHRGLDNINIFFHCCWRGAIVQSIIVALLDADVVLTLYTSGAIHSGLIYKAIMNGIAYFVYLQSSFIILSKMGVVSHTVGNSLRRPVCIGFAVVYFQNKVTEMAIMGIVLACVGAGAYSVFKATEIKKKEHSK